MKIKEWMIGVPIVLIVAVGSVFLTDKLLVKPKQTTIDTTKNDMSKNDTSKNEMSKNEDSVNVRTMTEDCTKGTIAVVKTWNMPKELREISGMAWVDSIRVATIQDTKGTIFIYNLTDEKIEQEIKFGEPGDYEGVTYAHGSYFVLRSDGYLFEINRNGKVLHEYDLPLTGKDDTESLFYDAPHHRLLIGQKEGGKDVIKKGIFAFDLQTRKFNPEPVYSFDANVSFCDQASSKGKGDKIVKPSDIAIHPKTNEIFMVDGPNNRVLVLSPEGTPLYFLKLDKLFEQAEGIMFSASGDLYISTEGVKEPGNISKVTVQMVQ
jgi:hypothetical protein